MTLSLFDGLGVQVGSSATASDPSPLTGDYFGYRNRFANTATNANISYDNFSIGPTPAGTLGDYNDDGSVDAADYVVWRRHLGTTFTLPHEDPSATPNDVTPEDYNVWRTHFGEGTSIGTSLNSNSAVGVPEPDMLSLAISTIVSVACLGRRRQSPSHAIAPMHHAPNSAVAAFGTLNRATGFDRYLREWLFWWVGCRRAGDQSYYSLARAANPAQHTASTNTVFIFSLITSRAV